MPKKSKPSFEKRQKELARQQRMKDKAAARIERKDAKASGSGARLEGEDPDIAGIRPGPQPLPEQWRDLDDEEPETTEDEA